MFWHNNTLLQLVKMAQNIRNELTLLRSMFPSWDADVLEELLVVHQGDVERTVDSVLSMDAMPNASIETQTPQLSSALTQTPVSPTRRQHSPVPSSSTFTMKKQPNGRTNLPEDFLRLPVDEFHGVSEQEERDAMLARMLQDQFFRDEVLSSDEFSSYFDNDRSIRPNQAYAPEKTAAEIANETYALVSKKFTSLSEVMKSRMHDMYMRFQMRNDASASKDPKSTRPLMQDDSDSSEDADLNSDIRRRNMDRRCSQGSPRRWSPSNTSRKRTTGTSAFSKKDD